MAIPDIIPAFLRRLSDRVFEGRNRTRIVLGTDRTIGIETGYGDGGENDPESAAIDIVAGYKESNPSMENDASRVYISGKSNPDEAFSLPEVGTKAEGEPVNVLKSDNVYLIGRNRIKLIVGDLSLVIEDGSVTINASQDVNITAGQSNLKLTQAGDIELGAAGGAGARIITENDVCVGQAPPGGGPVLSTYRDPQAVVTNQRVKIK